MAFGTIGHHDRKREAMMTQLQNIERVLTAEKTSIATVHAQIFLVAISACILVLVKLA